MNEADLNTMASKEDPRGKCGHRIYLKTLEFREVVFNKQGNPDRISTCCLHPCYYIIPHRTFLITNSLDVLQAIIHNSEDWKTLQQVLAKSSKVPLLYGDHNRPTLHYRIYISSTVCGLAFSTRNSYKILPSLGHYFLRLGWQSALNTFLINEPICSPKQYTSW